MVDKMAFMPTKLKSPSYEKFCPFPAHQFPELKIHPARRASPGLASSSRASNLPGSSPDKIRLSGDAIPGTGEPGIILFKLLA
jgi:hypothetical protein